MTQGERYLILGIGVALMVAGIVLFVKMKGQGNNRVKLLGIEVELSAPSLVIFVFGSAFVMFPFLVKQSDVNTPGTVITDAPTPGGLTPLPPLTPPNELFGQSTNANVTGQNIQNLAEMGLVSQLLQESQAQANIELMPPEQLFGDANLSAFEAASTRSADTHGIFWQVFSNEMNAVGYETDLIYAVNALYGNLTPEQFVEIPPVTMATQIRTALNSSLDSEPYTYEEALEDANDFRESAREIFMQF